MIAIVTCTGKRPLMMPLCVRWVLHQTVQPDVWIISLGEGEDLGIKESDLPNYAKVHRWSNETIGKGMTGQIDTNSKYQIEVLRQVPQGHAAVYFDDDDWYGPTYLEVVRNQLDAGFSLTGNGHEMRYSLALHMWMHILKSGCNAGATALAPDMIPLYIEWLQNPKTKWEAFANHKINIRNGAPRVSIKHGPGLGHLFPPAITKWRNQDAKWDKLREWIGDEDLQSYLDLEQAWGAS